jgi:hypothetical protein
LLFLCYIAVNRINDLYKVIIVLYIDRMENSKAMTKSYEAMTINEDGSSVKTPKKYPHLTNAGKGRPPGTPNKVTNIAREAIAKFVDKNSPRMQTWLEDVAHGIPKTDKEGCIKYDKDGNTIWLVQPNPEKAFLMLQAVMEYHLPKLARQEVVGDEQAPQRMVISWKRPE